MEGGNNGEDQSGRQASLFEPFCLPSKHTSCYEDVISRERVDEVSVGLPQITPFVFWSLDCRENCRINLQHSGAGPVLAGDRPGTDDLQGVLGRIRRRQRHRTVEGSALVEEAVHQRRHDQLPVSAARGKKGDFGVESGE